MIGNPQFFQRHVQLFQGLCVLEFGADFDLDLNVVRLGDLAEVSQA